jgi:hypothetical protein
MAGYKVLCALFFALLVVAPFFAKADEAGESGECVGLARVVIAHDRRSLLLEWPSYATSLAAPLSGAQHGGRG